MRLALTQKLLKSFHLSVLESQYYLAPVGAFFLLLAALPSELPHALRTGALVVVADHPLEFLASASLGVVASMMTFVVIKLTNSVTLKVLNTARNARSSSSRSPSSRSRRRRCSSAGTSSRSPRLARTHSTSRTEQVTRPP